ASELAKRKATNPAERLKINGKGKIAKNYDADFVIIDPDKEWELNKNTLETNINLLPFKNRKLRGKVEQTIVRGKTVFDGSEITVEPGYGKFLKGSKSL